MVVAKTQYRGEMVGLEPGHMEAWVIAHDPVSARNRQQLLENYPLVAMVLALYPKVPTHQKLITVVDRGESFIEAMVRLLGIKPHTVRYLRGRPPETFGAHWASHPEDLFKALDLIQPERRPTTYEEWQMAWQIWEQCGLAGTEGYLSRTYRRDGMLLQKHLFRDMLHYGCRETVERLEQMWNTNWFRLPDIADYFEFFGQWCRAVAVQEHHCAAVVQVAGGRVRDELLMSYRANSLLKHSLRWHERVHLPYKADGRTHELQDEWTWLTLPGLPQEYGECVIVELASRTELQLEGVLMQHCVGSYAYACLLGDSHIMSIRNRRGRSLSTMELQLFRLPDGRVSPALIQHRGRDNSLPSEQCEEAAGLIIEWLASDSVQPDLQRIKAYYEANRRRILHYIARSSGEWEEWAIEVMEHVLPDYLRTYARLLSLLEEEACWYRFRANQLNDELEKCGFPDGVGWDQLETVANMSEELLERLLP